MRYAIVIEPVESGYRGYAPDLPTCTAMGESAAAVESRLAELIQYVLDERSLDGLPPPPSVTLVTYVAVAG